MTAKAKVDFNWVSFIKKLAIVAVPVALQNLLTTTASMIDAMMLAPIGETTVAAVGLCAQFSMLMFSSYWGFVGGGMLFFAQYWGAKDHDGIDRSYGIMMTLIMAVGAVSMVLAIAAPEFIMGIYTDKRSIQEIGIKYLRIVGMAYPMQIISSGMSALLRSTERVRIPLYASMASVLTNIILNWVLIYGHLGAPALGVQGAAIATACAGVVNVITILIMSKLQGFPYIFHFKKHFCWTKNFLKQYFRRCFPILCNEMFLGIAGMTINMVLGRQSEQAIAAVAVFRTLEGIVVGFFMGFSSAASVLVGKCVGAGKLDTAYQRAKRLVVLCAGCIFVLCLVLLAVHKPLLGAMGLSGESLRIGTGILMIYCVAAVIRMCNWMQNDTYRAGGDAAYGTILEITFMYFMLIPAVCIAGALKAPFFVIFACCYIDEPIRFCMMQWHMYTGKWVKPVTDLGLKALPEFMKHRWKGFSRSK